MKRLPLWICFAGILSLFYCPSSARSHDWFSWRGPEQTGVSREKNLPSEWSPDPKNPTNFIWKAPYGCRSTPIVMNGRVYLNNQVGEKIHEQERVMCLDEKTGKLIWEKRFNVFLTDIVSVRLGWASLAGDPKTGNIYWHGTQGHFVCFDKDGKILWQRSLTEEYGRITGYGGRVNTPVVDEDLVIIGMMNFSWGPHGKGANRHLAMNKHTGEVVWWSESPHKPKNTYYSTPVIAVVNKQRLMITGGGEGYLHTIKVRTGEPVWNVKIVKGGVNPSPVMDGNLVYICHGAENVDSNEKGGIFCFDAGKVEDGKPKLVWKQYGISANYCSPLIKDGRLYICSDIARMYCLDSKTGKLLWRRPLAYGRNAKGSPVWADDKIYVCPVNGSFSIIQPGSSRGKIIHEHFFPPEGIVPAETNGTPAVANGRVFVCTRDETYCIGKKEIVKAAPLPEPPKQPAPGKPAAVRILPADVVVHPGDKVQFTVQLLDKYGYVVGKLKKDAAQKWSLPVPPSPPKAKAPLPALKGEISANGELLVDGKALSQEGLVKLETGMGSSTARIRVAPRFPYKIDFNDLPKGAAPGGWVNAQNKFFVTELDGEKVLMGNNRVSSPLVAKADAYIGTPEDSDYTISSDIMGTKVDKDLPDMGLVAHRYRLVLWGNKQQLRLDHWDAMPRVAVGIPYKIEPDVWYRMKLKANPEGKKCRLYGKVWPRDQKEPAKWDIEFVDPNPDVNGAPGLYRYSTAVQPPRPGTAIFFDNVLITSNKK